MRARIAVTNPSPFIILAKCGLTRLLPRLFSKIIMPEAVTVEIARGRDAASRLMQQVDGDWLTCETVPIHRSIEVWNLGEGETEVLSLVLSRPSDAIALIDDRAARRCAETFGLPTVGTAGLLLLAKEHDLIDSVAAQLVKLETAGLYLANETRTLILTHAHETQPHERE